MKGRREMKNRRYEKRTYVEFNRAYPLISSYYSSRNIVDIILGIRQNVNVSKFGPETPNLSELFVVFLGPT
jgi:hypothetical protein